jgi:hypothetical protein
MKKANKKLTAIFWILVIILIVLLLSCTPEPSCEVLQIGFINVINRTSETVTVNNELIQSGDSTVINVPSGKANLLFYSEFDTIEGSVNVIPCRVVCCGVEN